MYSQTRIHARDQYTHGVVLFLTFFRRWEIKGWFRYFGRGVPSPRTRIRPFCGLNLSFDQALSFWDTPKIERYSMSVLYLQTLSINIDSQVNTVPTCSVREKRLLKVQSDCAAGQRPELPPEEAMDPGEPAQRSNPVVGLSHGHAYRSI